MLQKVAGSGKRSSVGDRKNTSWVTPGEVRQAFQNVMPPNVLCSVLEYCRLLLLSTPSLPKKNTTKRSKKIMFGYYREVPGARNNTTSIWEIKHLNSVKLYPLWGLSLQFWVNLCTSRTWQILNWFLKSKIEYLRENTKILWITSFINSVDLTLLYYGIRKNCSYLNSD